MKVRNLGKKSLEEVEQARRSGSGPACQRRVIRQNRFTAIHCPKGAIKVAPKGNMGAAGRPDPPKRRSRLLVPREEPYLQEAGCNQEDKTKWLISVNLAVRPLSAKALLRNQVTNLIWYGRIETTLARAKEVRSAAEHLITLAIRRCDNTSRSRRPLTTTKGQSVTVTVTERRPEQAACPPSDHGVSVRREGAEAG